MTKPTRFTIDAAVEEAATRLLEQLEGEALELTILVTALLWLAIHDPDSPDLYPLYIDLQNTIHR